MYDWNSLQSKGVITHLLVSFLWILTDSDGFWWMWWILLDFEQLSPINMRCWMHNVCFWSCCVALLDFKACTIDSKKEPGCRRVNTLHMICGVKMIRNRKNYFFTWKWRYLQSHVTFATATSENPASGGFTYCLVLYCSTVYYCTTLPATWWKSRRAGLLFEKSRDPVKSG